MKFPQQVFSFLLGVVFIFGSQHLAFAIPCGSGGVSDSTSCQDGVDNNDKVSPTLTVNAEVFFGFDDWKYLNKYDVPGEDGETGGYDKGTDYGWIVGGTPGDDGTWSFDSSVWSMYSDVMIVVKSGKHRVAITGGSVDIFFSGYLLDNALQPTSGTWDTGGKDLSHLTLYGRGEGEPVPEPATMLLFGTGAFVLAGFRARRGKR